SRRRHTRSKRDWSSDVCSSDLALYLQTLHFDYVFDDKPLIVQNAFLKEPWSPLRAFHHEFWYGTAFVGYYRPLVIASFALNGRRSEERRVGKECRVGTRQSRLK